VTGYNSVVTVSIIILIPETHNNRKQARAGTSKDVCSEDRKAVSNNSDNCPKITVYARYKNIKTRQK